VSGLLTLLLLLSNTCHLSQVDYLAFIVAILLAGIVCYSTKVFDESNKRARPMVKRHTAPRA
jgi:hypothetical protein